MYHLLDDAVNEIRQPNPMSRFGQVAFQARHGRRGRQRMWPRELLKGLDVLLDGAEELVGVLDRDRFGRAVLD